MKITLLCIGKTDEKYLIEGIEKYIKRLKFYVNFNIVVIPDIKNVKNLSAEQQKDKEALLILKQLQPQDLVVLLDEHGKEFRSLEFSAYLERMMIQSVQHLVFIIGGPYGFDQKIYDRGEVKNLFIEDDVFAPNDSFVFYRTALSCFFHHEGGTLSSRIIWKKVRNFIMNKNKLMNLPNKRDYHYKSDEGEKNSQLNKYIMIACIIIVIVLAYLFA